jgi:hypothetical protein
VGGLDELVGVHHCCFTLLRNPLERFISEFFWRNRHDVESLRFPWRWNNELARWVDKLGEAGHANFYCSEFSTSSVDQRCFHPHLVPENVVNTSASELYAKAVSRLKSGYFFVGITELFEESLFYFARIIGCPALMLWTDLQHHSTTHAVGRGRSMKKYTADTMPIRTKRKLTSLLEADIELYERCREKFEDACKSDPLGGEFDDYKQAVFAGTSAKRRHGETASER